jgi:hypothetical protein
MPPAAPPAAPSHRIFARTAEVRAYHHDDSTPGKPLWLMIPAGIVGVLALLGIGWVGYQNFVVAETPSNDGYLELGFLLFFYIAGVFYFSYGYELYDLKKAIKLSLIIGVVGLALVVICIFFAALIGAAAKGLGGSKKSSSKSSSSGSSSSSSSWSFGSGSNAFGSGGYSSRSTPNLNINVGPLVRPVVNTAGRGIGDQVDRFSSAFTHTAGRCTTCDQVIDAARRVTDQTALKPGEDFCPECRQPYQTGGWESGRSAGA